MLDHDFKLLLDVTPQVVGIFWQTSMPLMEHPKHYATLDYLFNGLLSMHLSNRQESQGKNFFASTSFGRSIFLAHYCINDTNKSRDEDVLAGLVELCTPNSAEEKRILLLCEDAKDLDRKFSKRYPNFKFITAH